MPKVLFIPDTKCIVYYKSVPVLIAYPEESNAISLSPGSYHFTVVSAEYGFAVSINRRFVLTGDETVLWDISIIEEEGKLKNKLIDVFIDNCYIDEQGLQYSPDRKRLIQCVNRESDIEQYRIDDNCEIICSGAFCNCLNLKEIVIPQSVRCIGAGAFEFCRQLKTVRLSGKLEHIGENAFWGCCELEVNRGPLKRNRSSGGSRCQKRGGARRGQSRWTDRGR